MPRHLTQFDGLSFFHIVLNSDHGQVFPHKITTSVLATLIKILLPFNHWTRNFKS